MTVSPEPIRRTAWLYTRQDEAIRLELHASEGSMRLLVFGPGTAHGVFDFPGERELLEYQSTYERGLIDSGFSLRVTSDRRAERAPREPRDGKDRRRMKDEL